AFVKVLDIKMGCGSSSTTAVDATNAPADMKALQKKSKLPTKLIGSFYSKVQLLSVVIQGSLMERLKATFQICDEDKSGQIEKKELVDTFKKVAVTVFEETDKDGNGHLTKDEFLEAFHRDKRVKELITVIFVAIAKSMKEVLDNHSQ
ncbi:hypothetical protein LSH36_155g01051, partial [Paralvinella palmiformis]